MTSVERGSIEETIQDKRKRKEMKTVTVRLRGSKRVRELAGNRCRAKTLDTVL